ncbi:MAG: hypothetical protein JST87_13765 [Bacteroidetes bacterium]|nr:hypothetical protein [Bacteroidota bacterium]
MDAKITLSFDAQVIKKAKQLANDSGLSLSRYMEVMLRYAADTKYNSIEEMPISAWVMDISKGKGVYPSKKRTRAQLKKNFFESRIKK